MIELVMKECGGREPVTHVFGPYREISFGEEYIDAVTPDGKRVTVVEKRWLGGDYCWTHAPADYTSHDYAWLADPTVREAQ